jgi:preprotein translocase subunit SecD
MQIYKPLVVLLALSCGCAWFRSSPAVTVRFHEQVSTALPASRVRMVDVPSTRQRIAVDPFPQLTEKDIVEARLETTPGGPAVRLRFDLHGANTLAELTTRMRGQYVVVLVDDRPVAAVLVDQRVTNGEFLLEADFTEAEAEKLVADLNRYAQRSRSIGDTQYLP